MASIYWSLELCCDTLLKLQIIRVHGHAFVEGKLNTKLHISNPEALICEEALPQRRTENVVNAIGVQRASQPACGHYYLRMPKTGSIFSAGTKEPYSGYKVNPNWITS